MNDDQLSEEVVSSTTVPGWVLGTGHGKGTTGLRLTGVDVPIPKEPLVPTSVSKLESWSSLEIRFWWGSTLHLVRPGEGRTHRGCYRVTLTGRKSTGGSITRTEEREGRSGRIRGWTDRTLVESLFDARDPRNRTPDENSLVFILLDIRNRGEGSLEVEGGGG